MNDAYIQVLLTFLVNKYNDFENKCNDKQHFNSRCMTASSYLAAFDDLFIHCISNGAVLNDFDSDFKKDFDNVLDDLLRIFEFLDQEFLNFVQKSSKEDISEDIEQKNLKIILTNFATKVRFYKTNNFFYGSQSRLSDFSLDSKVYLFFEPVPVMLPFHISECENADSFIADIYKNSDPFQNKLSFDKLGFKTLNYSFTQLISKNNSTFESNQCFFVFVYLFKILIFYFVIFLTSCFSVYGLLYLFFE